eukprot:74200_1
MASDVRYPPLKKAKKPRVIKNSIVDLDDVRIAPGTAMKDWLLISKRKLREREIRLTRQRLRICDNIIISALQEFVVTNANRFDLLKQVANISTDHLYTLYKDEIRAQMCQRAVSSFRKYFQTVRRSSDVKKSPVMALECWIPIMQILEEFSKKAAAQFSWDHDIDLQRLYSNSLHTLILAHLCEGMIKPANTRTLSLIPSMAYQIFLSKYNYYLQIEVPDRFAPHQHKRIRKQYVECLRTKSRVLSEAFQNKLMCFYEEKAGQMNISHCCICSRCKPI